MEQLVVFLQQAHEQGSHIWIEVSRGKDYRTFIKEGAKTYKGERNIPLNKMVEPILIEAIAEMKVNPEGLMFYDYIKGDIITTS